jgi:hypothetical protein
MRVVANKEATEPRVPNGINKITKFLVKEHHLYREREIKGSGSLLFVFLEKPLVDICLVRIKEQVAEKRNTISTHRNVDVLCQLTETTFR